tara:strand:- start:642 stop:1118 length:477 start_codon:yes stop_codon:yes gene_type:complete
MAIRKSDDIANEGSNFANQKGSAKLVNIQQRFDDTTHNDNPYDDAIQYIKKKVDEIVDETNIQTTASGSYALDIKALKDASGSFATNVNTLTAASSSFAVGGGISELGVTATSAAFPTIKITKIQHAFAGGRHSLTIFALITTNKGTSQTLSTELRLA